MVKELKGILDRASFRVEGNRLVATGRLDWPLDLTFDICIRDLMENSSSPELEMDLRAVARVTSPYIGVIAAVARELRNGGRSLKIKANAQVSKVLASAGVTEVAVVETE